MKGKKPTFIVDPLIPTRELMLIAGGSGSGKSTLACQIAFSMMNCGEFFGHPIIRPQSVAYVAFDRSEAGMRRTFERTLETDKIPFPFYSTITSVEFQDPKYITANGAVGRLLELQPKTDILIVDGIGMAFKGDSGSLTEVSGFIHGLVRMLHSLPRDLTIIALHHMGKTKKGNEYSQPRQRLHGSVGWAATCETCILIEPVEEADPENPYRNIIVCPRNAKERALSYTFNENGCLIPARDLVQSKDKQGDFTEKVVALPAGDVEYENLKAIADTLQVPESTFKRWLARMIKESAVLKKSGYGRYERLKTQ